MTTTGLGAIVLAAGHGSRFGDTLKLLAVLDGRPLLQHVLDALTEVTPLDTVVVLGDRAAEVEAGISWGGERRVINPDPGRGLSSSVRLGLDALEESGADLAAALILLGDQPRVRPGVIRALVGGPADRPILVARYSDGGGPNPVLLRRPAWQLAATLAGDRGFGPFLAAHPELVTEVAVLGRNPDIDTSSDLRMLAEESTVV